jgi:hypothetical protein
MLGLTGKLALPEPPAASAWMLGANLAVVAGAALLLVLLRLPAVAARPERRRLLWGAALIAAVVVLLPGAAYHLLRLTVEGRQLAVRARSTPAGEQLTAQLPPDFLAVIRDVQKLTPPAARIRYFAPTHYLRSMGDYLLLPRNIHCTFEQWPRPDFVLVFRRDIPPVGFLERQHAAGGPLREYEVIRRWAPDILLYQRIEPDSP